jgi:hypothetical protein
MLFLSSFFKIIAEENTNKILYILISVERSDLTSNPIATVVTNYYSSIRNEFNRTNLNEIKKLDTIIKLQEKRFHELYDGIPDKYVGNGSTTSSNQLDRLMKIWYERDIMAVDIKSNKMMLEKLKGKSDEIPRKKGS